MARYVYRCTPYVKRYEPRNLLTYDEDRALPILKKRKPRIFIISGPSGSGKTTLYRRLLKDERIKKFLEKAVSVTTRPPRHNEMAGRDYEFVSRDNFLKLKRKRQLLESQNIFGYLYGTSKRNVEAILKEQRDVFLCVDVKGKSAIERIFPHTVSIFVRPPTIKTLESRLKKRSTEAKGVLKRRLLIARQEIKQSKKYEYVIVNDKLKQAFSKLKEIILKNY